MTTDYSTEADQKERFGGILENPYLSKLQRHSLDGFKVRGLARILKDFQFKNVLDVCCGLGEYSSMEKGNYVGLDNSFRSVAFGFKRYRGKNAFVHSDAMNIPFKDGSFDAVLQLGSSHHFTDESYLQLLTEIQRVSQRYIVVADIVRTPDQNRLSKFFYDMDRGTNIRTAEELKHLLTEVSAFEIVHQDGHRTFPGLYSHAVFVLERK